MPECGVSYHQFGGVVVDHVNDGEAQGLPGVLVGAFPGLAGGGAGLPIALPHAFGLDALAGVDVGDDRLGKNGLAAGDHFPTDTAGDFQCGLQPDASDPFDGDFDLIVELHHAVHGVGPALDGAVATGDLLCGGRQPHAVHEWCGQTHELGGIVGGVDGVVVTGDGSEWGHVGGRGDHGTVDEGPRGVDDFPGDATIGGGRHGGVGAGLATANSEAFHHGGYLLTVRIQFQLHGNDAPGGGFGDGGAAACDVDAAAIGKLGKIYLQIDHMVEVDGIEQTFDNWVPVSQFSGAQGGVDCGPAGADKHVRGDFGGVAAGHSGMGAGQFGRQVEAVVHVTVAVNLGQAGDGITCCGDGAYAGNAREQGEYRIGEAIMGHNRAGPGGNGFRQLQRNVNMFDVVGAAVLGEVLPGGVGVDTQNELVIVFFDEVEGGFRQVVGRVVDQVAVPGNGAGLQDGLRRSVGEPGEGRFDFAGFGGDFVYAGGFETAQQVGNGLVYLGDAADGNGAGNDPHRTCRIAVIVGLPQGVQAKPPFEVAVDDGHPGHGFVMFAVERNEPGGVAGLDGDVTGLRVCGQELVDGRRCVRDVGNLWEECLHFPMVHGVESGLDAVQQVEESVIPGGVSEGIRQFDKAFDPLGVGHQFDVAEVGFRGFVDCFDDFRGVIRVGIGIE